MILSDIAMHVNVIPFTVGFIYYQIVQTADTFTVVLFLLNVFMYVRTFEMQIMFQSLNKIISAAKSQTGSDPASFHLLIN